MGFIMTKKKLAEGLGFPARTFRSILNRDLFKKLEKIGYSRNQKHLTIKQVELICKNIGHYKSSSKATLKTEYARELNISMRTLSYWLNNRYYNDLLGYGYKKSQKYLNPAQVEYLNEQLVNYPEKTT